MAEAARKASAALETKLAGTQALAGSRTDQLVALQQQCDELRLQLAQAAGLAESRWADEAGRPYVAIPAVADAHQSLLQAHTIAETHVRAGLLPWHCSIPVLSIISTTRSVAVQHASPHLAAGCCS